MNLQIDRISPTLRPDIPLLGYQTWTHLLFVHWKVDADEIQQLLPAQLTIDTYDGFAWVGLVLFQMSNIHPKWFPALPGISRFPETNVRTYVHFHGKPGVWFFSLDASGRLATMVGRWKWNLPYYFAEMSLIQEGSRFHYRSARRKSPDVLSDVRVNINSTAEVEGDPAGQIASTGTRTADAGTFEHFLVERYFLYNLSSGGELQRGQVHHNPYPLTDATLISCQQTLLSESGIQTEQTPDHVLFSPGVDVEIFPLIKV